MRQTAVDSTQPSWSHWMGCWRVLHPETSLFRRETVTLIWAITMWLGGTACPDFECGMVQNRLVCVFQKAADFPFHCCFTLCLLFYFPVTPQAYQPPGFREADCDTMEFEQEPVKLTMGEVVSPYHTLKFDMATERHRLEQVNWENCKIKG